MINLNAYFFQEEIDEYNELIDILLEVARNNGYGQVKTPTFIDYDFYLNFSDDFKKNLIKTIDSTGRIKVLRPDITLPLCQLMAQKKGKSRKLSYITSIYRNYRGLSKGGNEFLQGGVELFYDDSLNGEIEIIEMAIEYLRKIGFRDLTLELSDNYYINNMIRSCDLTNRGEQVLYRALSTKNKLVLERELKSCGLCNEKIDDFKELSNLFGEFKTVIDDAMNYFGHQTKDELQRIIKINHHFFEKDKELTITADLSNYSELGYYNGTSFRIYGDYFHIPLVTGGRYEIGDLFQDRVQGFGFGVNINLIKEALQKENRTDSIVIALSKGRIADEVMQYFERYQIRFPDYHKNSRKLIFTSEDKNYEIVLVKAQDVPTYVENNAADLGIVGLDILREEEYDIYEVLHLPIGQCRMSVAGKNREDLKKRPLIIASKYPNIAKKYFDDLFITNHIVELDGSVELGPLAPLSDVIVDIVETGSTLHENGLEEWDLIMDIHSVLIANKGFYKLKKEKGMRIKEILSGELDEKN